jgi:hypothetical protein
MFDVRRKVVKGSFPWRGDVLIGLIFALAAWFSPISASGTGITYEFDTPFPTDPSPDGPGPWIQASFADVSPGTVLMTITSLNLISGEFVQGNGAGAGGGLFFNLNPDYDPTSLAFGLISATGDFGTIISTGANAFKADGDGKYDIQLDFATHNFSSGSSITYQLTGISGLTAADFAFLSAPAGGSGPFYAAAHVQGIPPNNYSTWIEPGAGPVQITSVPEPAPLVLFGVLLWGVWFLRTRSLRWQPAQIKANASGTFPSENVSFRLH